MSVEGGVSGGSTSHSGPEHGLSGEVAKDGAQTERVVGTIATKLVLEQLGGLLEPSASDDYSRPVFESLKDELSDEGNRRSGI